MHVPLDQDFYSTIKGTVNPVKILSIMNIQFKIFSFVRSKIFLHVIDILECGNYNGGPCGY